MSVQAMAWAMQQRIVTKAAGRHVLLCLANYAGAQGEAAFPSVGLLSRQTGLDRRTVQRLLRQLEAAGAIVRGNQAIAAAHIEREDRRPVVWDIPLDRMAPTPGSGPGGDVDNFERGDTAPPREPERGGTVSPRKANGAAHSPERGGTLPPEPSINRNGCVSPAGAREAVDNFSPPPNESERGSDVTEACLALRRRSLRVTPQHPELIAAIAEGVSVEALVAMHECYPDKPAGYILAACRRQHAEPASPQPTLQPETGGSTDDKPQRRRGEGLADYAARCHAAADARDEAREQSASPAQDLASFVGAHDGYLRPALDQPLRGELHGW